MIALELAAEVVTSLVAPTHLSTSAKQHHGGFANIILNYTIHTVLDTDNLHFSEEFLVFPARADTDICADALGFSARYRTDFPQDPARKNLDRNSTRICAENCESVRTYVKSLVKLSQFCYSFKDIRKYRKEAKASRLLSKQ